MRGRATSRPLRSPVEQGGVEGDEHFQTNGGRGQAQGGISPASATPDPATCDGVAEKPMIVATSSDRPRSRMPMEASGSTKPAPAGPRRATAPRCQRRAVAEVRTIGPRGDNRQAADEQDVADTTRPPTHARRLRNALDAPCGSKRRASAPRGPHDRDSSSTAASPKRATPPTSPSWVARRAISTFERRMRRAAGDWPRRTT